MRTRGWQQVKGEIQVTCILLWQLFSPSAWYKVMANQFNLCEGELTLDGKKNVTMKLVASSQGRPQDPRHCVFRNRSDKELSLKAIMCFVLSQHPGWLGWLPRPCSISHVCLAASPAKSISCVWASQWSKLWRGSTDTVALLTYCCFEKIV